MTTPENNCYYAKHCLENYDIRIKTPVHYKQKSDKIIRRRQRQDTERKRAGGGGVGMNRNTEVNAANPTKICPKNRKVLVGKQAQQSLKICFTFLFISV